MKNLTNIGKPIPEPADPPLIKPVTDVLEEIDAILGAPVGDLDTSDQTVVGAINELVGEIEQNASDIGDLELAVADIEPTISSGNLAGVVFNANLADNSIYHLSVGRDPGFYLITTFGTVTITTIVDMGTGGGSSITTSGGLNLKIDFGSRGRPYKLQKVQ